MCCFQAVKKKITMIEFARLLRKQRGSLSAPTCSVANHADVPGEFILISKFEQENENKPEWRK